MVLHVLWDKQLHWQCTLLALRKNRAAVNVHIWAAVVIACLAFGAALAALGLTLATIR